MEDLNLIGQSVFYLATPSKDCCINKMIPFSKHTAQPRPYGLYLIRNSTQGGRHCWPITRRLWRLTQRREVTCPRSHNINIRQTHRRMSVVLWASLNWEWIWCPSYFDTVPKVTEVTYLVTGQGQVNRSHGSSEFWQEEQRYMCGADKTVVKKVDSDAWWGIHLFGI